MHETEKVKEGDRLMVPLPNEVAKKSLLALPPA